MRCPEPGGMWTATAELSGNFRSSTTVCPRMAARCHAGRTPDHAHLPWTPPWSAVGASRTQRRPRAGCVVRRRGDCRPDHHLSTGGQGEAVARTPVRGVRPQTPTSAWQGVPHSGRPDGTAGSGGRSIRRPVRPVTTSSTLPQGRPCGRPPAAAVLGRQRHASPSDPLRWVAHNAYQGRRRPCLPRRIEAGLSLLHWPPGLVFQGERHGEEVSQEADCD
jgi:hypothetical protein